MPCFAVSKVKFKESTITAEESSKKATVVVERTNVDGNAPGVTVSLLLELDSASAQDLTKPNPFQVTFGDGEKLAQTDVMLQDDKVSICNCIVLGCRETFIHSL